jgi:hypothetical protein
LASNAVVIPVVMFPFALLATKWLTGTWFINQASLIEEWLVPAITLSAWVFSIQSFYGGAIQDQSHANYTLISFAILEQTEPMFVKFYVLVSQAYGIKYQPNFTKTNLTLRRWMNIRVHNSDLVSSRIVFIEMILFKLNNIKH